MSIPQRPALVRDLKDRGRLAGTDPSGGFAYSLDLTQPVLVTAIHAGSRVRTELRPLLAIADEARQREEDRATDRMIQACPSALWGLDSRAEYDLNRAPESAVPLAPEMFWGQWVYRPVPDGVMIGRSRVKYDHFYTFVGSLLTVLLERHGTCVVYDIHSYNLERQRAQGHPAPPVFNVGTRLLNPYWRPAIDAWISLLARIAIPGIAVTVAENDVFGGQGEFCRRLTQWDPGILVLPTEIAKVYMDEHSGCVDPQRVAALARGLARAVAAHGPRVRRSHRHPQREYP